MGFTPINKVHIERIFPMNEERHLIVKWRDQVLDEWQEKKFPYLDTKEAFEFASKKFSELAM